MMNTEIKIKTPADWEKIQEAGLKVVVDPMVFRTADVYLRGYSGNNHPDNPKHTKKMWHAISNNIGSLCMFFDALILEECLPMYDYETTFPPDLETGKKTLIDYCNESEEILVNVKVCEAAYQDMKKAALASMDTLPPVPADLASEILLELCAFDWEWRPDLWYQQDYAPADDQRVLDAFRYGGLLFSGYAQRTGSDHILQPKRARLYLANCLGSNRAEDEQALFAELDRMARETPEGMTRMGDLPPTPTFLPYLLAHDDETPHELLRRALKLRRTGMVQDYRDWKREMLEHIDKGRPLNRKMRREMKMLADDIKRELGTDVGEAAKVNAKIAAKVTLLGPEISAEAGVDKLDLGRALGWVLQNVPGYRYRKLLTRLIMDEYQYVNVGSHLQQLWEAA